jgi:hypothetical protein
MTGPRLAAVAALALGLIVLGWVVFDRVFIAPGRSRSEIATATAGAAVATGRQAAAEDATRIVERYHDRTTEIRTIQAAGVSAVQSAPDAVAGGRAARRAICMLDAARQLSDPACQLFETGAGVAVEGREGLADPGH